MTLKHLIAPEERRKKLKKALESKRLIRGIETHNAISALISNDLKVEKIEEGNIKINEFDFFWESSLTDSASKGHPDIEIISLDSRLKTISEILDVTDKPLIMDGDTGGDIHHFEYLIPRIEKMGVSAIIIEDKIFPKRNSLDPDSIQEQEEPNKFSDKIRAGKNIQNSDDFMIIARIESLIAKKGIEDALIRAKKYLQAGADAIMIHSNSKNPEEILNFAERYQRLTNELNIKKPLVCVPTTYNSIYESELAEKGFNIVIYANHMLRASYQSMKKVGKIILENERSFEADPYLCDTKEIFEKVGFLDIKEKDIKLYSLPPIIIPAAGENPELKYLLNDLPKPLIKINEKTILEHQIFLLKKLGFRDINAVIGYQKDKFNINGINYFYNPEYNSKGPLHSLMKAKEKMRNGFIYLNSDILVDERLIKELLTRNEDIVFVIDNSFLYHKHKIDKELDAVITKKSYELLQKNFELICPGLRKTNDEIISIGSQIPREKMTHEFIGLAKFSKQGAEELIRLYEICQSSWIGKFNNAECFEKADYTDLFQEMINRGYKIAVHETNGGWIEIHNEKDIKFAEDILR